MTLWGKSRSKGHGWRGYSKFGLLPSKPWCSQFLTLYLTFAFSYLLLLLLSRFSRVRPHRWQPTRLPCPWDSPGKNTGVGCHFLLQCMKVESESEVVQFCPTLRDPMDCSPPGSSFHGIIQARVLEWVAIACSVSYLNSLKIEAFNSLKYASLVAVSSTRLMLRSEVRRSKQI